MIYGKSPLALNSCSKFIALSVKFCYNLPERSVFMKCPSCGIEYEPPAAYCADCGTPLTVSEPMPNSEPTACRRARTTLAGLFLFGTVITLLLSTLPIEPSVQALRFSIFLSLPFLLSFFLSSLWLLQKKDGALHTALLSSLFCLLHCVVALFYLLPALIEDSSLLSLFASLFEIFTPFWLLCSLILLIASAIVRRLYEKRWNGPSYMYQNAAGWRTAILCFLNLRLILLVLYLAIVS